MTNEMMRGVQGPKGDTGEQGLQGPQGSRGTAGLAGSQGPQGERGIDGIAGPCGPQGVIGPQGVYGPQGERGETGPEGIAGPQGDTGGRGPVGPCGPQGDVGPQGPEGDHGPIHTTTATSETKLTIEKKNQVIMVALQSGYELGFISGMRVRIARPFISGMWMEGVINYYVPATGEMNVAVDLWSGSGEFSHWTIVQTGNPGVQGPRGETGVQGPQGSVGLTACGLASNDVEIIPSGIMAVSLQQPCSILPHQRVRVSSSASLWCEGSVKEIANGVISIAVDGYRGEAGSVMKNATISPAGEPGMDTTRGIVYRIAATCENPSLNPGEVCIGDKFIWIHKCDATNEDVSAYFLDLGFKPERLYVCWTGGRMIVGAQKAYEENDCVKILYKPMLGKAPALGVRVLLSY